MARTKKIKKTSTRNTSVVNRNSSSDNNYFDRIESEIKSNQSTLSLVLGALIILVIGVLLFNYFSKDRNNVGPAQNTEQDQQAQTGDVSPESLPGKYTVKEGDTLFVIADKYYQDGYKYTEIVKANNLTNENVVEVGQTLEIPKIDSAEPSPSTLATSSPEALATPQPQASPSVAAQGNNQMTQWGEPIKGDTYTVVEGDWLSTIAARAYGDVMSYQKIAQSNNITNPDLIEPGMVLKLPR
jgi:nucleoid-associated protein YgaU